MNKIDVVLTALHASPPKIHDLVLRYGLAAVAKEQPDIDRLADDLCRELGLDNNITRTVRRQILFALYALLETKRGWPINIDHRLVLEAIHQAAARQGHSLDQDSLRPPLPSLDRDLQIIDDRITAALRSNRNHWTGPLDRCPLHVWRQLKLRAFEAGCAGRPLDLEEPDIRYLEQYLEARL